MRLLLFTLLLIGCGTLRGQDLIVTTFGDSIPCTITSVAPNRLFYTVKDAGGTHREDIALDNVAMYKREGYFPVVLGSVQERTRHGRGAKTFQRWMLTGAGGYSYRTAPLASGMTQTQEDYVEPLRHGAHAMGSLHFFVEEQFAIGVVYSSFFNAKSSMEATVTLPDSSTVTGLVSDDIRLRFIGIDVLFRPVNAGNLSCTFSAGAGYLEYIDHATLINQYTITGNTIALNVAASADYKLTSTLSLGARLGYVVASLDRFEVDLGSTTATLNLLDKAKESVNRLDPGVVLRLRL